MTEPTNKPRHDRPASKRRLPHWLKRPLPAGKDFSDTRHIVADSGVATVCEEARCPNRGQCWAHRTATFMILGDKCTRRCRFCSVHSAQPEPPQSDEPQRLADAVRRLQLKHVVITSVTRDDLPDEGAGHFAACIQAVREQLPSATIEILPPDFHARRDCIQAVCEARPDVFNHNLETVERITPEVRPQAGYRRSLETLRLIRELAPEMPTKSGLMVGLGETMDEIRQTLADLRAVDCNIVTVGQYLSPTSEHYPVQYFWTPEEFQLIADYAHELGFAGVASGPFVRSSYNAGEVYEQLRQQNSTT